MSKEYYKIEVDCENDVEIEICDNGIIRTHIGYTYVFPEAVSSFFSKMRSLEYYNCYDIWKQYSRYRSGDRVIRSGSGLCGVYDFNPDGPFNDNYIENVTMHSTSCEELARNIFSRTGHYGSIFNPEEQRRIIRLLRYHDLGEDEHGDQAEDGSIDPKDKFEAELTSFVKKVHGHRFDEQLIRDFIIFEHADSPKWSQRDRQIFQFAKLVDKTDSLLSAFVFEKQGRKGTLRYKKEHFGKISEQDQRFIDEIHEDSEAGVFTAHVIDSYKDYFGLQIFICIVVMACLDVRGYVFPWLHDFLEKREIFSRGDMDLYDFT